MRDSEQLARNSAKVAADEAKQLLDNPAFERLIVSAERRLMAEIVNHKSDGSKEADNKERELCRELRTFTRIKAELLHTSAGARFRSARDEAKNPTITGN